MKQSILFEQGKLYVVELPEKPTVCHNKCSKLQECSCDWLTVVYENRRDAALANKVEVKNPELIGGELTEKGNYRLPTSQIIPKRGQTFPLPADLTFDKETGMLKRIEPEKSIARRLLDETPQDVRDKLRADANAYLRAKRELIEPEETQAQILWDLITLYEGIRGPETKGTVGDILEHFTIQRKKS